MRKPLVALALPNDLLRQLDRVCNAMDCSRSSAIRCALDAWLRLPAATREQQQQEDEKRDRRRTAA